MRSWFARVRISAALDGGQKLPESLRERTCSSAERRGFEQEMAALDHALKATAPKPRAPASLHRSIMRAVESSARPAAAEPWPVFLRWLVAPAVAVVALLVVWQAVRNPVGPPVRDTQCLADAASALQMGSQVARAAPSAVVAPLSDELNRLNRDLDQAAEFLLASLP